MSSPVSSTSSVMWAPVVAFSCILAMMGILLSLPFLLTRARRVPALNRALDKLACLMGAPWPPYEDQQPQHVRKPLSRTALNSLALSHYKASAGTAAATAATDSEAQSEDAECCPICFCEYSDGQAIITLPCKHFFHKECISRWLKRDATCPMCKLDLQERAAEQQSSSSSSSGEATASTAFGGGNGRSNGAGQAADVAAQAAAAAAAAAQPAAAAVVAGVPAAAGSSTAAAAAAAGGQVADSISAAEAEVIAQPAGQDAGSSTPAPLQVVVVAVQ